MRLAILSAIFCCLTAGLGATGVRDLNERGVQAYRKGSYDSSLSSFNEAQKLAPESRIIDFNVGNALHQQGRYEEALLNYKEAYDPRDSAMAAEVFYNMGNTYFRAGHLDSAVAAYKQALIANPEDRDAKFNLELALKKLEQQQQQQCQQDQQDDKKQNQQQDQNKQDQQQGQSQDQKQDQDKKDQQQEQDQHKQDKEQQNQDQNQQQQDQNDQGQNQEQPQDQPQEQSGDQPREEQGQSGMEARPQMDEQRAEALLNGLNQDEKEILQKLVRQKIGVTTYKGKGW